jgi:hypothetical protein
LLAINPYNGRKHVMFAYYLNNYPLEVEDCECEEEHDDGCPHTGWFVQENSAHYDECYVRVRGEVIAYAVKPTVEEAEAVMEGPW